MDPIVAAHLADLQIELRCPNYEDKNGGTFYILELRGSSKSGHYDSQSWTIERDYDSFSDLNGRVICYDLIWWTKNFNWPYGLWITVEEETPSSTFASFSQKEIWKT